MAVEESFAYGDESGIADTAEFCLLAGYVASPRQWKLFTQDWNKVLKREGIKAFHSFEFFQPEAWKSHKNPYHGWSKERGHNFIKALLEVLSRRSLAPIGGGVENAVFNSFKEDHRSFLTGGVLTTHSHLQRDGFHSHTDFTSDGVPTKPYFFIFHGLVADAVAYSAPGTEVHFWLDRQDQYEVSARRILENIRVYGEVPKEYRDRIGDLTFTSKDNPKRGAALQAADMYVHLWNRAWSGRLWGDAAFAHNVLKARFRNPKQASREFSEQQVLAYVMWRDRLVREDMERMGADSNMENYRSRPL